MGRFTGIVLNHYMMPVADQHTHRIGCQCNAILLESGFLRYTKMQLCPFGFNVKRFFKRFVTKGSADNRLLLGHEPIYDLIRLISGLQFTIFNLLA
jgi:hypothetical protein